MGDCFHTSACGQRGLAAGADNSTDSRSDSPMFVHRPPNPRSMKDYSDYRQFQTIVRYCICVTDTNFEIKFYPTVLRYNNVVILEGLQVAGVPICSICNLQFFVPTERCELYCDLPTFLPTLTIIIIWFF